MTQKNGDPFSNYTPELLQELHILTREGKLNQDSRRKLKQIEHLTHICYTQLIQNHLQDDKVYRICDVGAGKNYFSFLLWDRYFRSDNTRSTEIIAIEARKELSEKSKVLAEKIGFKNFYPVSEKAEKVSDILPENLDLIVALHACDTATDDAILLGLKKKAKAFVLVPCCQAEIAAKLENFPKSHPLFSLWRHPLHRREFGSHMTNALRALFLEAQGYKVRVTEFVGLEHSLKNELILAEKVQGHNGLAQKALTQIMNQIPIESYLLSKASEVNV